MDAPRTSRLQPYGLLFFFLRALKPGGWRLAAVTVLVVATSTVPVAIQMLPAAMGRLWTYEPVELFGTVRSGAAWLRLGAQLLVGVTVASMILQLWQQWVATLIGENIVLALRNRLFDWLKLRSLAGESAGSLGELVQQMSGDVMQVQQLLYPGVMMAAIDVCRITYTVIALLLLEFRLTLWLVGGLLLVMLVSTRLHRRLIAAATRDRDVSALLTNQMVEASAGSRDLVAAGRFDRYAAVFRRTLIEKRSLALTTNYWGSLAGSTLPFFIILVISFYYLHAVGVCCENASVQVGRVTSYAFLMSGLLQPIGQVAAFRAQVVMAQPAMISLHRVVTGTEPQPGQRAVPTAVNMGDWSALRAAAISFSYPGSGRSILRDVDLIVPRGSFTGIVGESGSGKSTLAGILLGSLKPTAGDVGLAGPSGFMPLADGGGGALVGYIPQQPFIFDTSIRENLLMGLQASEVPEQELHRVVHLAQLSGLIARRADDGGLDAPCGPGGRLLSGGERQRIALARTLLARPDIIICDEYTANIDAATALLIHQALTEEFRGRTRIVVSHQLYALRGADQLVVLHDGVVQGAGRHEDLLRNCDTYKTFWELQRLEA